MNEHAQWRLDFARDLSPRLARFAGIQAIVVGGSVAKGYSDAYSDLELMLFWDQAPGPEIQQEIKADFQAEFRYPEFDIGHNSSLLIRGVPVDLWHLTVSGEEAAMDAVLNDYSLDLGLNNILDTMQACISLYGHELVQQWKERVQDYPDQLAIRFLETYLPHFHMKQLNLAARRDNPTAFYNILSNIQSSLFLILLALNYTYFPTYKWMYPTLAGLSVGPAQIGPRLRKMFYAPPLEAATQLRRVLAETLTFIEARYPQVDTTFARYGLDQEPRAYELP
jgi:hypothetical protein